MNYKILLLLLIAILFYGCSTKPTKEEATKANFGSESTHFRNTETTNLSPYAMFGDSSFVLMTEEEREGRHFLDIYENEKSSQVKKFTMNFNTGIIKLYSSSGEVLAQLHINPTNIMRFLKVDRYASKYPHLNPYNFVNNDPIKNIDPTGDTIVYDANLSIEQTIAIQKAINKVYHESDAFKQVIDNLHSSDKIYEIKIGFTDGVAGTYTPNKGESSGGVITFESAEKADNVSVTVEEFFHAFQDDIKLVTYPNVSTSNIEFESKVFKYIVFDDIMNARDGAFSPLVGETGFTDNMDKDYIFERSPLMQGDALNLSAENLKTKEFQEYYFMNLQKFVKEYKDKNIPAPTYTTTPSKDGPEAIIKIQESLGR